MLNDLEIMYSLNIHGYVAEIFLSQSKWINAVNVQASSPPSTEHNADAKIGCVETQRERKQRLFLTLSRTHETQLKVKVKVKVRGQGRSSKVKVKGRTWSV